MLQKIDELNVKDRVADYFNGMNIPSVARNKRIKFALDVEEIIYSIFSLLESYKASGKVEENTDYLIKTFRKSYSRLIDKYIGVDDYIEDYLLFFCENLVNTTVKNINSDYYVSQERSVLNACDCANDVLNYGDYKDAIKSGKTKKQWLDVKDKRERESHLLVGGSTVGINEYFQVGSSQMLFPHDTSGGAGAEEIANCRCAVLYK